MTEIIIEIPELFGGFWCFHNAEKQCPFAYRLICPAWGVQREGTGGYGDRVHCSLGLNDAEEIDEIGKFSAPGSKCPGAGKKFKLVEAED